MTSSMMLSESFVSQLITRIDSPRNLCHCRIYHPAAPVRAYAPGAIDVQGWG
jgi:hypothetical protein